MTTLEILVGARNLIAKPENWTRHLFAADAEFHEMGIQSEYATCFCAIGAIARVGHLNPFDACSGPAVKALAAAIGKGDAFAVSRFNDTQEHAEVLAAFDRAIAAASPSVAGEG